MAYLPLRDYSLIGNMNTAALVGKNGSLDWMCAPYINSPSIFAAILDDREGGRWQIEPKGPYRSSQKYYAKSAILETTFTTKHGRVRILDWMEISRRGTPEEVLYREVRGDQGVMPLRFTFQPKFHYALKKTFRKKITRQWWRFYDDDFKVALASTLPLEENETDGVSAEFTVGDRDRQAFRLRWDIFSITPLTLNAMHRSRKRTEDFWKEWLHRCPKGGCYFAGPWHDLVLRSSILLKMLEHPGTGAFAAAPTTSLPEAIGGERNWDYRYSWIRDSAQIIRALMRLGHQKEADAYFSWVAKRAKEDPIPILTLRRGGQAAPEQILEHLEGYKKSKPVRIGNAAAHQIQHDIYGEILDTLILHAGNEGKLEKVHIPLAANILDRVIAQAMSPDSGIWEVRGEPEHFVYSKLRSWQALNLGIKLFRDYTDKEPSAIWFRVRRHLKKEILDKGVDKHTGAFKRAYDDPRADASLLLVARLGFLPARDSRVVATICKIEQDLSAAPGFFYRYRADDGLEGKEGAFLLCSFWYVEALLAIGQRKKARRILEKLIKAASPTGLYPEEIDPKTGEFLGNYPQAYTHIGLLNAVLRYQR